jgi:hypothetical protein
VQDYVCQVAASTSYLFDDICGHLNLNSVTERQLVQRKKFNNRSITKDKPIEWLEIAFYLLDIRAIPQLEKAT